MRSRTAASYGFDAPGLIQSSLLGGAFGCLFGSVLLGRWGWIGTAAGAVLLLGGCLSAMPGVFLVLYGLVGKYRLRDSILSIVPWRGDELVLDAGTVRGLLLVGAAKRLTTGSAIGIDIWRESDLSGNARASTLRNVIAEGVEGRVQVRDGDIRRTDFRDGTFDIVLSLLCLHNIEDAGERAAAFREIARVLKPGGHVVVGEYFPMGSYVSAFAAEGLEIESARARFADALSPMWLVHARKPMRE